METAESPHQAAEAHDRAAARYERLAFHWMKRGKVPQAALARRQARLHLQTALFERQRGRPSSNEFIPGKGLTVPPLPLRDAATANPEDPPPPSLGCSDGRVREGLPPSPSDS
jgi:hypothetical protein